MRLMHRSGSALRAAAGRHLPSLIVAAVGTISATAAAQTTGLFLYPEDVISGLSADGRIACGWYAGGFPQRVVTFGPARERLMWSVSTDPHGGASSVSADGSTICGWAYPPSSSQYQAFRRRSGEAIEFLPIPSPWIATWAVGSNGDGSVIVGVADGTLANRYGEAFIWSESDGTQLLGYLQETPGRSFPCAVSEDGRTVVGGSTVNGTLPFVWRRETGMVQLPMLPRNGTRSGIAHAISRDAEVIVGESLAADGTNAVRWISGALQDLGRPPGYRSAIAVAVDARGDLVVVNASAPETGVSPGVAAFIWTPDRGFVQAESYLTDAGIDLPAGFRIARIRRITPDGLTLVGDSYGSINGGWPADRGFIATIGPCPADWDRSGGVDGDDIAAFFSDWERGEGDIDRSGGTDIADLEYFFSHWSRGC